MARTPLERFPSRLRASTGKLGRFIGAPEHEWESRWNPERRSKIPADETHEAAHATFGTWLDLEGATFHRDPLLGDMQAACKLLVVGVGIHDKYSQARVVFHGSSDGDLNIGIAHGASDDEEKPRTLEARVEDPVMSVERLAGQIFR